MKNAKNKLLAGLLIVSMAVTSGCAGNIDSKDDPLSGYSVDSFLPPFSTRDPSLADTPTPEPSATGLSNIQQSWQHESAPAGQTPPPATATTAPAATARSYTRLEPGSEGGDVTLLQNRLIELGYLTGTADGKYGTQTQNAIKLFQKALGISQTGIANVSLQEKLFSATAPAYSPSTATAAPGNGTVSSVSTYSTLVRGDSGDAVATLQRRLIELGYLSGGADGQFGGKTESAVKAFQAALGLTQSGVASSSLQEKLFAAGAPVSSATAVPTAAPTARPTAVPTAAPTASTGYTELTPGLKNSLAVQQMQNRLKDLGYFTATATGNYYSQTTEAVKLFQTAVGLSATGTATSETLSRLYASNAPYYTTATAAPTPTVSGYTPLSYGSRGDEVTNLQKRLIALNWMSGSADGIYGRQTVSAVQLFQAAIGYEQTGSASVELQTILFSAVAPANSTATAAPTAVPTAAPTATGAPSQYTQLQPGSTGDAVKRLQTRLKELGYFNGLIGGNYLTKTTAAVKLFESAIGRAETGIATIELQEIIFSAAAPKYSDVSVSYMLLEKGDSGNQVENLQQRLIELGWLSGPADGDFGTNTKNAVAAFQSAAGLESSGVATVDTQTALFDAAAPHAPAATAVPTAVPTVVPTPTAPVQSGYQALQPGDSGELVKAMQARLKELGYFSGNVAGNYLEKTTAAVQRFQAAAGYAQDGVASSELLELLYSSSAPYYSSAAIGYYELSKGSSGTPVYSLQQRLIELGWLSGPADGDFGSATEKAVSAFQAAAGLSQNGVADAATQQTLFASGAPVYTAPVVTNPPATEPPAQSGYQALQPGDSGELVKAMQARLKELGYFSGNVAGNYLEKTTAAVQLFQAAVGYTQDGIASSALLELLYSSSAPYYSAGGSSSDQYAVLSAGSSGDSVRRLQQRLIDLGWLTGPADGEYGENTARAVQAFQYQIAQNQDGVANIELQERLFAPEARMYVEYHDLAEGMIGDEVLAVQMRLIELGYLENTEANTDGEYGPLLSNAIALLQANSGVQPEEIDGVADIEFQTFLFSDNALPFTLIETEN